MQGVMRFWLERGADGFRIDALRQTIKDDELRDNPPNPDWRPGEDPYHALIPEYTTDRPEVQEVVRLLRATVDEAADRDPVLIGELYLPIERLMAYYGSGLHLPANFHLLSTPWDAERIAALVETYEAALPDKAWPNWVLGNHDRPRVASRVGAAQARAAAVLLLTLRGTPTLYYGDELGMEDVDVPPERRQDPWALSRDPARTPMQWDGGPNAGFSRARPWLPLPDDPQRVNVAAQKDDPGSPLSLYRELLALRRAEPALATGDYRTVAADDGLLVYDRGGRFRIALNLGAELREVELDGEVVVGARAPVLAAGEAVISRLA
jgi:alpha-glucosidase